MIISVYLPIVSLIHRLQAEFLGVVYFLLFDGRTMGLLRDTAMIFHDKVRLLCRVTSLRGQPLVHFLYRFLAREITLGVGGLDSTTPRSAVCVGDLVTTFMAS